MLPWKEGGWLFREGISDLGPLNLAGKPSSAPSDRRAIHMALIAWSAAISL